MLKHPHQKLLTPAREAPRDAGFYQLPTAAIGGGTLQGPITSLINGSGDLAGVTLAQVTVRVAPCGRESLLGTSVEVADHSACIFDLPSADLVGAWVFAAEGVATSVATSNTIDCHWIANNRCCVAADA